MTPPRRTLIRTRSRAHQLASAALEERLWRRLRRHRLGRPMFHRDYPVGSAILEFYCPVARLVVEIDRGRGPAALSATAGARRTASAACASPPRGSSTTPTRLPPTRFSALANFAARCSALTSPAKRREGDRSPSAAKRG
jgi:hypothetical protein